MLRFSDIECPRPSEQALAERYAAINERLGVGTPEARQLALADWDSAKRDLETWLALAEIRFHQDTSDEVAKANRAHGDAMKAAAQGHDVKLKRRLLADDDRLGLTRLVGDHAVRLWETDVTAFDPAIADDVVCEAALVDSYTALTGSAKIEIDGKTVNLSGLAPYLQHPDRAMRHDAARLRWAFFEQNGAELDRIFDDLMALRHGMATKLGYENFVGLAYKRMRRTDYGPEDVARYREQILTEVVPLLARIYDQRREQFGWDRLMAWDEPIVDPEGNPAPIGDAAELLTAARGMFAALDERLGAFGDMMANGGFLDLETRETKARGGFCTVLPTPGVPFVFANFTGTHGDATVLTHEIGHAFQMWQSRNKPIIEYLWPTAEACEIHSMALEFLAYPELDRLFGDVADRYRRLHMIYALNTFVMCAAIDHFQHMVYERPTATAAERHTMWRDLERRYMPWRDYGDLVYPAKGGSWQWILHVYMVPFYFIDYALAQCVAMQLWTKSETDRAGTFDTYAKLCASGGSAPFLELVRDAGLVSPFADGALSASVAAAERELKAAGLVR
jgi:M3 family oligoendopeptidase